MSRRSCFCVVLAILSLCTVSLMGCGDGSGQSDADAGNGYPDGGDLIRGMTTTQNPSNALSYFVDWETRAPADTQLTVSCGQNWTQTYSADSERQSHSVFVMGLWEGAECTATARSTTEAGETDEAARTFTAGPLPDFLPNLTVRTRKQGDIQPGWTITNLTNGFDGVPFIAAMVDSQGRYRWYHQSSASHEGSDTEVRALADGVLIAGDRGRLYPKKVNWAGETQWKANVNMHHDFYVSDDGSALYYLAHNPPASCPQDAGSDSLEKYARNDETTVESWILCDYWFPSEPNVGNDWSHLNTIEPVPDENETFILSSREQHTLFKFDAANEKIHWRMGVDGEFGLSGEDLFLRQHDPEILPNGNILLFDNGEPAGGDIPREWSRALEISYDTESMTAEVVWQFRPDPDIFTRIWGDADRLMNGNTLITFGYRNTDDSRNSRLMEVTPSSEKVWDLEVANKWGWYRADRVSDPPTGYVVDAGK